MAKENSNIKEVNEDIAPLPLVPKKRKKGNKFFMLFIILAITVLLGFVFRKQIGNYLGNTLKNVPVANKIFKQNAEPISNVTKEQLIKDLEISKMEKDNLNQEVLDLQVQNQGLEEKMNALKKYESQYTDFLNQKQAWDEKIAKTNPKMFLEQFEKMYPDTMEKIYKDIKIDAIITTKQKEFCNTVGQMEEVQAAKALEELITTDPELIKLVFEGMEQERKSLILSSMQSQNAAIVIKLLSPSVDGNNVQGGI